MDNPLDLFRRARPRVSVLRLEGVIGSGVRFGAPSLTDAGLAPLIEAAFRRGKPKAVALAINSPGGSAAQSSLIAARIRRLADEKQVPVHAFVEDVAASGGYWLATAADRIHVDPNSIVGSIGVISASFGFQEFLARHGIERRVHTAGEDKSLLDPFRPERPEDVERLKRLQAQIHGNFIAQVKARRGDRLGDGDLFTGDIWVGQAGRRRRARRRGRAPGADHARALRRQGRLQRHPPRRPLFRRLGLPGCGEALDAVETQRALDALRAAGAMIARVLLVVLAACCRRMIGQVAPRWRRPRARAGGGSGAQVPRLRRLRVSAPAHALRAAPTAASAEAARLGRGPHHRLGQHPARVGIEREADPAPREAQLGLARDLARERRFDQLRAEAGALGRRTGGPPRSVQLRRNRAGRPRRRQPPADRDPALRRRQRAVFRGVGAKLVQRHRKRQRRARR